MTLLEILPRLGLGAAAAAGAMFVLLLIARRFGWIDRVEAAPERKHSLGPVPLVGGAAILIGAAISLLVLGFPGRLPVPSVTFSDYAWPGILAGFALGLIDDLVPRGLGAGTKLLGQLAVGAAVFAAPGEAFAGADGMTLAALGVAAVVAMNVVNTYDHADGLAGGLAAIALVGPSPALAGGAIGYLPFNTRLRGRPDPETGDRPPLAMMGDSGSHALGVAIATVPGAAWFLLLPALDLARVALGRIQRGRRIWVGDRTHIGHRLAGLGLRPTSTALLLGVAVSPPLFARSLTSSVEPFIASLVLTVGMYLAMLVATEGASGIAGEGREDEPQGPPAPGGAAAGEEGAHGSSHGSSHGPFGGAGPAARPAEGDPPPAPVSRALPSPAVDRSEPEKETPSVTQAEGDASAGPFAG